MDEIDQWIRLIQDHVKRTRDPEASLREILPRALAEAYQDGRSWGLAEGKRQATKGARATLDALISAVTSPEIRCPRCDGREACRVCGGSGKFPESPTIDPRERKKI